MADIPADITTKAQLEGFGAELGTFSGTLEFEGDHDWIKLELTAGQTYNFYACFLETGSGTSGNSTLTLRDATGAPLLFKDDGGVSVNALLTYPITTTGTYFIDIGSFANSNTGEYSLFVRSATAFPLATVELLTFNNDISSFASGTKIVLGGSGADVIDLGSDSSTALGEQGNDIITGDVGDDHISGGLGHDTIHGSSGHDTLFGDSGDDTIFGSNGFDRIFGGAGDDVIDGGADADVMTGGTGKDFLRGRDGIDAFVFRSPAESPRGAGRDVIIDFETGDQISLTQIDAKSGGADNAFKFIGTQGFHHKAGELRYKINAANDVTLVQGDVNGDGRADFEIELTGQHVLHPSDFFL